MAEKVTFDGAAKTITIKAGVTEIDVQQDLFMAWKEWVATEDGHMWLPAFKPAGREPTNEAETQFTPAYFFLLNGWSIIGNTGANISIQTNLYPDPNGTTTTASMFVTSNNTNIFNRQSDAPIIANELELALEYAGVIYIDTSVTESGQEYPYGTSAKPVGNAIDAQAISELYNINNYYLSGNLFIPGGTFDNFVIRGAAGAQVTADGNASFVNAMIYNCIISGDMGMGSSNLEFHDCHVDDGLINVSGHWFNTGFKGHFTIRENTDVTMIDAFAEINGQFSPILTMPANPASVNTLNLQGYKGGLEIDGFIGAGMNGSISFAQGKCLLNNTNTGGYIELSGFPISALTDNSAGTTVATDSLLASQSTLDALQIDLQTALEEIEYRDKVVLDTASAFSGTAYPAGVSDSPVNNLADALIIMEDRSLDILEVRSDVIINQAIEGISIVGVTASRTVTIQNAIVEDVRFALVTVAGTFGIGSTGIVIDHGKVEDGTTHLSGYITDTAFKGEFWVADNSQLDIIDSVSVIPGTGSPQINFENVLTSGRISIRRWAGGLRFVNMTIADIIITASYVTGKAHIENSNTAGYISVRGLPYSAVNDNRTAGNTGLTIDTTGTVSSQDTLTEALAKIEYNGRVVIDVDNGLAGTEYPIGTIEVPVNNLADALTIAEARSIRNLQLHSSLVIDQPISNYRIDGTNGGEMLTFMNVTINGTYLYNLIIAGMIDPSAGQIRVENCQIAPGTTGLTGAFKTCGIMGDITIVNPEVSAMIDCFTAKMASNLPDPTISFGGTTDNYGGNWSFVNFANGVKLANLNNANSFIDFNSNGGNIEILPSCTGGTIRITGVSENTVTDNSDGTTVLTETLAASATLLNQTLEKIDYANYIVIDTVNGVAGTEYPTGTQAQPSNNLTDAHEIAELNNIYNFKVQSDLVMNIALSDGYTFTGKTGGETLTFQGHAYPQSIFKEVYVIGDLGGALTRFEKCRMTGVTNFVGSMWECIILDDIDIASGAEFLLRNCATAAFSEINANTSTPVIRMGALADASTMVGNIRGWHGPLQISNMDNTNKSITIHSDAGFLIVDDTNTDGWMFVQGYNPNGIVDLSSGTFYINTSELKHTTDDESRRKSKADISPLL